MTDVFDLHVVFDAADPDRVATFWLAALPGYDYPNQPPDGFATWDAWADANNIPVEVRNLSRTIVDKASGRPDIFFLQVPDEKAGKNRVHLDIKVARGLEGEARRARIETESQRLRSAGATVHQVVDGQDGFWIVMRDPEGNEFCVS